MKMKDDKSGLTGTLSQSTFGKEEDKANALSSNDAISSSPPETPSAPPASSAPESPASSPPPEPAASPVPPTSTGTPSGPTAGGFVMPDGVNKEVVYQIIAAEGGNISPQEAVNIASTMINRARAGNWGGGTDIFGIATAPDQYVVYQNGTYASTTLNADSRAAVDALFTDCANGGATPHSYQSFRSNGSTGYGGNILVPGGNRYK